MTVSNFDFMVYKSVAMYVNDSELHSRIGEALRERRKQSGMTQVELAGKVGLLRTSITNIEAGRQKAPLHVLYNICLALDIEVREVLPTNAEAVKSCMVEMEIEGKRKSVPPKAARLLNELLAK
jgi:transcriptional regulator with XRE-family HTH domain